MFGLMPKVDPVVAVEEARKIIIDQHSYLPEKEEANVTWHEHFARLRGKRDIVHAANEYADAFYVYTLLHDKNHPKRGYGTDNDDWDERRQVVVAPVADFFTRQIDQAVEILKVKNIRAEGEGFCCPNFFCNYFFLLDSDESKIKALRLAFYRFAALRAPMIFHWQASELVQKMLEECDPCIRDRLQKLVDDGEVERRSWPAVVIR